MTNCAPTRPTWAEVSRTALLHNFLLFRAKAAQVSAETIAVIKADAYGHGAREAQQALVATGCRWFAVTSLEEACALPLLPSPVRMLALSGLYAGEAAEAVRRNVTPVLSSEEQIGWLAAAVASAPQRTLPFPFHLEIDTGMARQGVQWNDTAALSAMAASLTSYPQLALEGVMTHFASPEDPASSQTTQQIRRFGIALDTLRALGCHPPLIHAGNSASIFDAAQTGELAALARHAGSQLLMRPGIGLYGYGPRAAQQGLQPVLGWKTRITGLRTLSAGESVSYNATFVASRPTRIALLPVGYADGYNRLLSNCGEVLVRGMRAPIAGRVTMDQTMIDVTNIAGAAPDDEVVLIGSQADQSITAEELAAHARTIPYEVLCAIGPRVPRLWLD